MINVTRGESNRKREIEEVIEGDCKERSRRNVTVFKIKRGERKEVWRKLTTPDKCMTNRKKCGWKREIKK